MKRKMKIFAQLALLFCTLILSSCSSMKTTSDAMYEETWRKVVNSQAWLDDLVTIEAKKSDETEDFYVTSEDVVLVVENRRRKTKIEPTFEAKYDALVKKAYIRIIAQAEKVDNRLEREYILRNAAALKKGEKRSEEFDRKLETVNKRYHAHREMLKGLKAWNITSEYGTDDLKFFKDENQKVVKKMIDEGKGESVVINYLIYRLADLYHFES